MVKIRITLLAICLIGFAFTVIFTHESIHWLQYSQDEDKHICFFGYNSIAYLIHTTQPDYLKVKSSNETEATIISNFIAIVLAMVIIKNGDAFIIQK